MMTTFHWIHILAGAWLAFVNFMPFLAPNTLLINNVVIGLVVLIYNVYMLFAKNNTDVKNRE